MRQKSREKRVGGSAEVSRRPRIGTMTPKPSGQHPIYSEIYEMAKIKNPNSKQQADLLAKEKRAMQGSRTTMFEIYPQKKK